ncbi:hypothetical protein [Hymenobacter psychrotolerans]|uniref:Uncharacterized protein n=1 Tax=Hymenobacter psychrotolerans DSM 18569 TaxID=1121959 RepID=A0A1M7H5G8_9BACT|nr:hypothetical protein [Hymenobacter psychrotolerans]SHM23854.1 hypothetical protein SAMN02746009_04163 [Hymenobacter psychrotolerans DSM 18569]
MSYLQVIRHIEQILNGCGDPIRFTPTGRKMLDQATMQMAVEVMKVDIQRTNDCFTLPPPVPPYAHNRPGLYTVNIIHIPPSLAEAYSAGNRYPDEELTSLIRTSAGLFSCYLLK